MTDGVEVFATMSDNMNTIPSEDFIPGAYIGDSAGGNVGKEWITGPRPAKFVGAVHRNLRNQRFGLSSFAVLGISLCANTIRDLVDGEAIPQYEETITVEEGALLEQTLDITTVPPLDGETAIGDQYQNCVDLSVTLDDGKPLPDFMTFDPLTRKLSISPHNAHVGQYFLHVNYDYKTDTDNNPDTHEHSVPLSVEVSEAFTNVSQFFIPLEDPLFEDLTSNTINSTNETLNDNSTAASNDTQLSEYLLEIIGSAFNPEQKKKKKTSTTGKPEKDPHLNITSISESGHLTIYIDTPIVVPQNYTSLPTWIFDVWYVCNSYDPVALAQNFTYNLTSFTNQYPD